MNIIKETSWYAQYWCNGGPPVWSQLLARMWTLSCKIWWQCHPYSHGSGLGVMLGGWYTLTVWSQEQSASWRRETCGVRELYERGCGLWDIMRGESQGTFCAIVASDVYVIVFWSDNWCNDIVVWLKYDWSAVTCLWWKYNDVKYNWLAVTCS